MGAFDILLKAEAQKSGENDWGGVFQLDDRNGRWVMCSKMLVCHVGYKPLKMPTKVAK